RGRPRSPRCDVVGSARGAWRTRRRPGPRDFLTPPGHGRTFGIPPKYRDPSAAQEVSMTAGKAYTTDRIRNVVFLGHGGCGKTTLIDALCSVTGTSKRRGNVRDGTAITMYAPEEVGHGISIQTAVAHAVWADTKINLLDTPGYLDFTGEALAATRVADGAVVVLGATSGVEVGTEKVWEYC